MHLQPNQAHPGNELFIPVAPDNEEPQNLSCCNRVQNMICENFNPIAGIGAGIFLTTASGLIGYTFTKLSNNKDTIPDSSNNPLSDVFSSLSSGILAALILGMASSGIILTATSCRRLANDLRHPRANAPH